MGSLQVTTILNTLEELVRKISVSSLLPLVPKVGKWLVGILFLLHVRSWPLVWHFRVFRPVFRVQLAHRWIRFRGLFKSPTAWAKFEDDWFDSIAPLAAHPFTKVVPYKTWASLDDCDFNGHLSNSSYAKILDGARFKAAMEMFPMFFRSGGWVPLAGTHFSFVREIPMLSSYEIRTSIATWDQKWIYVMSKFVRRPDGKQKKKRVDAKAASPSDGEVSMQTMSLRTPGPDGIPSASETPSPASGSASQDTAKALNAVAAGLAGEEPDGAILHTVVISQVCYKVGRITVPPGLVLGINGFTGFDGFTRESPHPQWEEAKKIMSTPYGGSPKKLKAFLEGGWRQIPEGERWWEQALGDEVEAQRVKNLSLIEGLKSGLENARTL